MSKTELQTLVKDKFPDNAWSFGAWLAVKFGPGMLFAVVFAYATNTIYQDQKEDRRQFIEVFKASTAAQSETSNALQSLSRQIENNTRAIELMARQK